MIKLRPPLKLRAFTGFYHRLARHLGTAGVAGLVLILAAAGLFGWQAFLEAEADEARQTLDQRRRNLEEQFRQARSADAPQDNIHGFMARMPEFAHNADDLALLFELAQRHGIEFEKGDYRVQEQGNGPFVSYALTLPVRASYGVLKSFTAEAQAELPHLALQDLRLERSDIASPYLDARLRLALYYRRAGP